MSNQYSWLTVFLKDCWLIAAYGYHIDGLVQERLYSSALAMHLCRSCTNPSIWHHESLRTMVQVMTCRLMAPTVFKTRSETCRSEAQFCQNLYMIKKESLPDRHKFCRSGSAVRHLFWRLHQAIIRTNVDLSLMMSNGNFKETALDITHKTSCLKFTYLKILLHHPQGHWVKSM